MLEPMPYKLKPWQWALVGVVFCIYCRTRHVRDLRWVLLGLPTIHARVPKPHAPEHHPDHHTRASKPAAIGWQRPRRSCRSQTERQKHRRAAWASQPNRATRGWKVRDTARESREHRGYQLQARVIQAQANSSSKISPGQNSVWWLRLPIPINIEAVFVPQCPSSQLQEILDNLTNQSWRHGTKLKNLTCRLACNNKNWEIDP